MFVQHFSGLHPNVLSKHFNGSKYLKCPPKKGKSRDTEGYEGKLKMACGFLAAPCSCMRENVKRAVMHGQPSVPPARPLPPSLDVASGLECHASALGQSPPSPQSSGKQISCKTERVIRMCIALRGYLYLPHRLHKTPLMQT